MTTIATIVSNVTKVVFHVFWEENVQGMYAYQDIGTIFHLEIVKNVLY